MSDTPRTDFAFKCAGVVNTDFLAFTRELERENAALKADNDAVDWHALNSHLVAHPVVYDLKWDGQLRKRLAAYVAMFGGKKVANTLGAGDEEIASLRARVTELEEQIKRHGRPNN